jgi:hypothetical protein
MTSFTFSAEQIRSAPPDVRRWMEEEIGKALSETSLARREAPKQSGELAACSLDEIAQIFNLISGNFLVTQVFFELARETPQGEPLPELHAVSLAAMQKHTQLANGEALAQCLSVIDQAVKRVRNNPSASLFATDGQGHVFIHAVTCANIRVLREKLLPAHSSAAARQAVEAGDFAPTAPEGGIKPEFAFGGRQA